ncbi:MAG: SDR family oxidoreductase [Pseudanabaenaceae cyanobacterium]
MNWAGKKALVTGGSRGIGKAIALALQALGIEVAVVSRSSTDLPCRVYQLDLLDIPHVKPTVQKIVAECGGIDILINNAGTAYVGEIIHTPLDQWQRVFDLNVTSVFQCIQAVLPTMRLRHSGTIVNIISIAGKQAFPKWGCYCASKFALWGLTQALAQEEQSHGIRVMALCPGAVDTALWDSLDPAVASQFDRTQMLSPQDVAQALVQLLLLSDKVLIPELTILPSAGVL